MISDQEHQTLLGVLEAERERGNRLSTENERLKKVVNAVELEAVGCYQRDGKSPPCPVMRCPRCGAPDLDMDGFGCIACPRDPKGCYCSHPSSTDGICEICGAKTMDDGTIVDDGISY